MQTIPDWATFWRELVEIKKENQKKSIETPGDTDYWAVQARKYDKRVKTKWAKPDVTRQLMQELLQPQSSIIDIGAGTGAWTLFFSNFMHKVTAIEPSKAMRDVLCENIKTAEAGNIEIIPGKWPDANPEEHDYVFCSHAMYETKDFPGFAQKMVDRARKMCFLLIRAPSTRRSTDSCASGGWDVSPGSKTISFPGATSSRFRWKMQVPRMPCRFP